MAIDQRPEQPCIVSLKTPVMMPGGETVLYLWAPRREGKKTGWLCICDATGKEVIHVAVENISGFALAPTIDPGAPARECVASLNLRHRPCGQKEGLDVKPLYMIANAMVDSNDHLLRLAHAQEQSNIKVATGHRETALAIGRIETGVRYSSLVLAGILLLTEGILFIILAW